MHRRVTRELCISRNGNLKSPASMRFSGFLCGKPPLSLEGIAVHWLCKLLSHTHESCWTAEGGCRYANQGRPRFLPRYLRRQIAFPTIPCEKECVLCRFMILPRAAAESSICRAAPCCVLSACLLSVCCL